MSKGLKLSIALAAMLIATPAMAVTVTSDDVLDSPGASIDPTSASANYRPDLLGNDFNGTAPEARSPWEDTAYENTTGLYDSVSAGGYAIFDFGSTVLTGLSIMWGSPDSYNRLTLFDSAGAVVYTLDGPSLPNLVGPFAGFPIGFEFVNIVISDILFSKIRLDSFNSDAFEFANFQVIEQNNAPTVPLPAGLLLLLSGLGGLGFLGRARAKTA